MAAKVKQTPIDQIISIGSNESNAYNGLRIGLHVQSVRRIK